MRRVVLCPMGINGYDTDIQFDDFNKAYEYSLIHNINEFAVLDSLSLEYYCGMELY